MPLIFANIGLFKASFAKNIPQMREIYPSPSRAGELEAENSSRFNAFPPAVFRATMMLKAEDLL